MSTWLSNSKAARIEVSVEILHTPGIDGVAKMSAFIDVQFAVLRNHFPRISVLKIVCPDYTVSELIMAHLAGVDCRRIGELCLMLRLSLNPVIVRDRPLFTFAAPALRKLSTSRCLPPTALHFTGHTVVDLRLVLIVSHKLRWSDLYRALSAFPKIRYLKLGGVLCAGYPPDPQQIVYRHLTHMSLSCFAPSMISIIRLLTAPALSNLRLVIRDATLVEELVSVIRPKVTRVTSLDLCVSPSLSSDQIITLLASFKAVRAIDLSSCSVGCRAPMGKALGAHLLLLPHLVRIRIGWDISSEDKQGILGSRRFARDCDIVTARYRPLADPKNWVV
ncbi:hypothetical protein C8R47DRAFT_1224906 [Mycena vitilis]|nr:hypothetical protein C8R47DRAFT_1224906 [Mycena vitilis]